MSCLWHKRAGIVISDLRVQQSVLRDELVLTNPQIIVLTLACSTNLVLSILPCYSRCCANNYLHWGALASWLLLSVQGCYSVNIRVEHSHWSRLSRSCALIG